MRLVSHAIACVPRKELRDILAIIIADNSGHGEILEIGIAIRNIYDSDRLEDINGAAIS